MIRVKICGITNIRDAVRAADEGVDALGFIFYPKSQRHVLPEKAREVIQKLPPGIVCVGVFVNQEIQEVKEIASFCDLTLVQLHGDEPPRYCRKFPRSSVIKAVSPRAERDIERIEDYPVRAILVDAYKPGCYGGTGERSDWSLAVKVKKARPLILAGGLHAENIREALTVVRPQAVDINSGVEISPGKKDHEKMRKIIAIVHETEFPQEKLPEEKKADDTEIFTRQTRPFRNFWREVRS